MHPDVHFSLAVGPDYSVYNVALRGLPVLCTTSLLGQEEQVKVKCFAQGHNTRPAQGLNSQPWDHESGALAMHITTKQKQKI